MNINVIRRRKTVGCGSGPAIRSQLLFKLETLDLTRGAARQIFGHEELNSCGCL
jgi:hypothetical protein